jgi:hypothetical protein
LSPIFGLSFVAPATARLACTLVACAGLALLAPAPASGHVDSSTGVVEWQTSVDPAGDREWTNDVVVNVSDDCDDDDDGGDESSSASGLATFDREHFAPPFSSGARLVGVADVRYRSRERDGHLLRGPPPSAKRSSDIAGNDDAAGPYHSGSNRGTDCRAPHVHFVRDPFRSACAAPDDLLRAPP